MKRTEVYDVLGVVDDDGRGTIDPILDHKRLKDATISVVVIAQVLRSAG